MFGRSSVFFSTAHPAFSWQTFVRMKSMRSLRSDLRASSDVLFEEAMLYVPKIKTKYPSCLYLNVQLHEFFNKERYP
jgi:hypothetical protein